MLIRFVYIPVLVVHLRKILSFALYCERLQQNTGHPGLGHLYALSQLTQFSEQAHTIFSKVQSLGVVPPVLF